MKFAKELERDAVPEWRVKYLNYKAGKKHVKAVARATHKANAITPRLLPTRATNLFGQPLNSNNQQTFRTTFNPRERRESIASPARPTFSSHLTDGSRLSLSRSVPSKDNVAEDDALNVAQDTNLQYGSFVPTPPRTSPTGSRRGTGEFELPSPAMFSRPDPSSSDAARRSKDGVYKHLKSAIFERRNSSSVLPVSSSVNADSSMTRDKHKVRPSIEHPSPLRRIFSYSPAIGRNASITSLGLEPLDLVREREHEFYDFMNSELEKVEAFYKLKEEQAGRRLELLRDQLHEMRNRRLHEIIPSSANTSAPEHIASGNDSDSGTDRNGSHIRWVQPIKSKLFPPGPNSKALHDMPQTPHMAGSNQTPGHRDYTRGPEQQDVSYRTAKRKLKLALQEFYRGLELLKSYVLLNRTAFRKINKKFDKACNARPPLRFVNEKVNKAWFVNSDLLENHIKAVEDLYARYFERGNHKVAAGKLRSLAKKSSDESGSSFLNGFLIGTGIVFSVQGLVYGVRNLFDSDDITLRVHTGYLMQIYGGYFLMLTLFSYFCLDCFIWTRYKVNYSFIFELDPRSRLDWRCLSGFPSFFLLLFGVSIWANFSRYGSDSLYLYYPVVLIAVTIAIIFFPFHYLAYKSRRWLAYSHWRLLLAGIYPVEFRDFFLGDIYCSLTYCMANLELFFCLYANHWEYPSRCNSNNSRLLGFLTTVPALWRFFQCIRRFKDTKNVFPHLVNAGKYSMTIISCVMLSLYRIDRSNTHLALFVFFSMINSIYCSIWDLFMDFSLLQFHSNNFWLRDILALKQRWPYYFIMIVDPILRFNWILYVVIPMDANHSTIFSFGVAFLEVTRRGMWSLFRVENEHCANVGQYKASRDVPLPYRIEPLISNTSAEVSPKMQSQEDKQKQQQAAQAKDGAGRPFSAPGYSGEVGSSSASSSHALDSGSPAAAHVQSQESQGSPARIAAGFRRTAGGFSTATGAAGAGSEFQNSSSIRRRPDSVRAFSKMLANAHMQDFEKKRKKVCTDAEHGDVDGDDDDGDDDDDDDDVDSEGEEEDQADVRAAREAARLRHRADSVAIVEEGNFNRTIE